MNLTADLISLQKSLFDFSRRNSFLHVKLKDLFLLNSEDELNRGLDKIYQKSSFYWKEYGLETALQVEVFLKWTPTESDLNAQKIYYSSPLLFRSCVLKLNRKIDTSYSVKLEDDYFQFNPLIQHYFKIYFDLDLPKQVESIEEGMAIITQFFNEDRTQISFCDNFDEIEEWQLIKVKAIGVFNYKKSKLSADFDEIIAQPNDQIKRLITGSNTEFENKESFEFQPIAFLDDSQSRAIKTALSGDSLVIQGPPGTGKSHTIVALIAGFLSRGKKVLFVSEKKSALDVVAKRLEKKGLGDLIAYFNTDKNQKKAFYQKLRNTWQNLNQQQFEEQDNLERISFLRDNLFEIYPSKFTEYRTSINGNLDDLIQPILEKGVNEEHLQLQGRIPDFKLWKEVLPFLKIFENQVILDFDGDVLGDLVISEFNALVFSEQNVLLNIEKRINDLQTNIELIEVLQQKYAINENIDSFTKLAITASVLSMVDRVQIDLLNPDSKKYKSFNSIAKKHDLLKTKLSQAVQANKQWTRKPSISEINELLDLISQAEKYSSGSILQRLRRNPAKLKTRFSDFHSGISDHTKIKLLDSVRLEWRLKGELDEIRVQLKHDYNIVDPDNELDLIFKLRNKLNAVSQDEYLRILEHENSSSLIQDLSKIHPEIIKFNSQCRYLFQNLIGLTIHDFNNQLNRIKTFLPQMNHWLGELKAFFDLDPLIRNFLVLNKFKIDRLDLSINYAYLLAETRFEPLFNRLDGGSLLESIQLYKKDQERIHGFTVRQISKKVRVKHRFLEDLLARANFKLKSEQKEIKKNYKLIKRTIIHEIGKKQRHLSVREFFKETTNYLTEIQPLWMMNPLTVSEYLPCEANIFDVVIFDESSQIPLEDSLPAIYRAKQVVVVGDSQQMPPPAFFSNREETKTILDQAEQVYKAEMLRWHYRSKHPDLIRFSNLEFYNGDLLCLPPKSQNPPFELHKIEGNYESGINLNEAHAIANYCEGLVSKSTKKILIIAFSQAQEIIIQNALASKKKDDFSAILTRNLENVQGVEADIVIISIGYGKDQNGNFKLNFGPVNQLNGANRLNVLFTRAIEKMVVFTSVNSADFGFSENRGVQVLKDFLKFVEEPLSLTTVNKKTLAQDWVNQILMANQRSFNFHSTGNGIGLSAFVHASSNKILLVDPGLNDSEIQDLPGLIISLLDHFSEVKIILSLDIWRNPERIKSDLLGFFVD